MSLFGPLFGMFLGASRIGGLARPSLNPGRIGGGIGLPPKGLGLFSGGNPPKGEFGGRV